MASLVTAALRVKPRRLLLVSSLGTSSSSASSDRLVSSTVLWSRDRMSVRILLRLELALLRLLSLLMRLEDELLSEDRMRMLESPLESRHSADLLGLMTRSGRGRVVCCCLFCSCSTSPRQVCLLWHKSQSELQFQLSKVLNVIKICGILFRSFIASSCEKNLDNFVKCSSAGASSFPFEWGAGRFLRETQFRCRKGVLRLAEIPNSKHWAVSPMTDHREWGR